MKRREAKGLGGGWDRMRGVKRIQFICNKTGTKRMRRDDAARNYGHWWRRRERAGPAWHDYPTTCPEVTPKPAAW